MSYIFKFIIFILVAWHWNDSNTVIHSKTNFLQNTVLFKLSPYCCILVDHHHSILDSILKMNCENKIWILEDCFMVNRFSVSVVNRKFEAFQIMSKFVSTLYYCYLQKLNSLMKLRYFACISGCPVAQHKCCVWAADLCLTNFEDHKIGNSHAGKFTKRNITPTDTGKTDSHPQHGDE